MSMEGMFKGIPCGKHLNRLADYIVGQDTANRNLTEERDTQMSRDVVDCIRYQDASRADGGDADE